MTPLKLLAAVLLCSTLLFKEGVEGWGGLSSVPSESECRPYIEKALKEQAPSDSSPGNQAVDLTSSETEGASTISADQEGSIEETEEATTNESIEDKTSDEIKPENVEESLETEATTENSELASESTAESGEASLAEEAVEEKAESLESTEAQETAEEVKTEESSETGEVTEGEAIDQSVEDAGETLELESTEATSDETQEDRTTAEEQSAETPDESTNEEKSAEEETKEDTQQSSEQANETKDSAEVVEEPKSEEVTASEDTSTEVKSEETQEVSEEAPSVMVEASEEKSESTEENATEESAEATGGEVTDSVEEAEPLEAANDSTETADTIEASPVEEIKESVEETVSSTDVPMEESAQASVEEVSHESVQADEKDASASAEEIAQNQVSDETATESAEPSGEVASESTEQPEAEPKETNETEVTSAEGQASGEGEAAGSGDKPATEQEAPVEIAKEQEPTVEDQLTLEFEAPKVRRSREHIAEILKLNPESAETELLLAKTIESTLKELKRLYDAAIKPLEILYKYRDLSNRHFGDPEIFSKPLILFMGPWSGGKSTILNYLMDNEFKSSSLRTGAEPSPAYFNILMWGEREEVLDGTQLAADWTFSGLQKFGQGLLDRLRGLRLNNPLLEKVNIVEIPGILEIRKQVERLFPFNDACQWFIDRADIIFLVYDPSKLDVGPETEAILDQLKGREYQTRIILNKADQVKPEELMRVQGTLIWNISPLMSSMEPPVMYSTSLWSIPYEQGAPSRLLHAQERAFLRDLRTAIDKRVENKIASARRFAVRVRNHAKMVDCYLTTYYNHKTFFGNRKKVADEIIEHPQNYHIYEGLSTLTNISRYDLPDPEVYRDFFRLNSLYDFQRLSETCTFFRGCPINRLDVSIAYDLPELVGKYKKQAEKVLEQVADKKSKS